MTGLQFLACEQCGRVHAEPAALDRCRHCGADRLVDITARVQADTYFRPPGRDRPS